MKNVILPKPHNNDVYDDIYDDMTEDIKCTKKRHRKKLELTYKKINDKLDKVIKKLTKVT